VKDAATARVDAAGGEAVLAQAVAAYREVLSDRLVAAYALSNRDKDAGKALEAFKKAPFTTRYDLDRITQYYKEEQFQNPTLQAATAELLNGLRKAGLK